MSSQRWARSTRNMACASTMLKKSRVRGNARNTRHCCKISPRPTKLRKAVLDQRHSAKFQGVKGLLRRSGPHDHLAPVVRVGRVLGTDWRPISRPRALGTFFGFRTLPAESGRRSGNWVKFTNRQLRRQSLRKLLSWDFGKLIIADGASVEHVGNAFRWLSR